MQWVWFAINVPDFRLVVSTDCHLRRIPCRMRIHSPGRIPQDSIHPVQDIVLGNKNPISRVRIYGVRTLHG